MGTAKAFGKGENVKKETIRKASSSLLWQMIALGVAELAKRKSVEIRRINGESQATIHVVLQDARPGAAYNGSDIPALLCVGQRDYETFAIDAATVARINCGVL